MKFDQACTMLASAVAPKLAVGSAKAFLGRRTWRAYRALHRPPGQRQNCVSASADAAAGAFGAAQAPDNGPRWKSAAEYAADHLPQIAAMPGLLLCSTSVRPSVIRYCCVCRPWRGSTVRVSVSLPRARAWPGRARHTTWVSQNAGRSRGVVLFTTPAANAALILRLSPSSQRFMANPGSPLRLWMVRWWRAGVGQWARSLSPPLIQAEAWHPRRQAQPCDQQRPRGAQI